MSLKGRLLAMALTAILFTALFTGFMIRDGLEEIMATMINTKLDAQVNAFSVALREKSAVAPARTAFLVEFRDPRTGWGWRIRRGHRIDRGGVGFGSVTPAPTHALDHEGIVSGSAITSTGDALQVRIRRTDGGIIEVAAPDQLASASFRLRMREALLLVALLSVILAGAAWIQLRAVLLPLRRLRDAVAGVRAGTLDALPEDQPTELEPLATEMNALIAEKETGLANARKHMANLAHGLKTPLATLALRLVRDGASPQARTIVIHLDRQIEHHLNRARVAASGASLRSRADAAAVAGKLARAIGFLHRDRGVELICDMPGEAVVAVDPQDLEEMVGNLLDNAFRHARSTVRLTCSPEGQWFIVLIEDDGPGIAEEQVAGALAAGVRLDETGRGYGFGLGISQELAELYGGMLRLARSVDLGGLAATIELPRRI